MRGRALLIAVLLTLSALAGCSTDRLACGLCGAAELEVDELTYGHGVGSCVNQAACRVKGHYIPVGQDAGSHVECGVCGEFRCSGTHGEGRCQAPATPSPTLAPTPAPTLEPTPSPTLEPTPSPAPEPREPDGAGEEEDDDKAGDWTLEDFYVALEDGREYNLSDPEKRKGITCSGAGKGEVIAIPRSDTATVSGDVGEITIRPGENRYSVTVTSESGRSGVFHFVITRED